MKTNYKASCRERIDQLLPRISLTAWPFTRHAMLAVTLSICLSFPAVFAQTTLSLQFTALNNQAYEQLDSIRVCNLTHPGDTMLYFPDTTLILYYVTGLSGGGNVVAEQTRLSLHAGNPYSDHTTVGLYLPSGGNTTLNILDITGKRLSHWTGFLERGEHSFQVSGGVAGMYVLQLLSGREKCSLRLVSACQSGSDLPLINYVSGQASASSDLKNSLILNDFWFCPGDELLCIGYAGTLESGFNISPQVSALHVFQFASGIPCPDADSVLYEGQWYHTVQIFSQCWMAENLNVGVKINTPTAQTNNGIIEKYCLSNNANSCLTYGGVYLWDEMMQYSTVPGAQGICPTGWHIPTDHDWQVLAGAADSYYPIGHSLWNYTGNLGNDCGYHLKSTTGWYSNGNGTNMYGFNAISGGFYYYTGNWAGGSLYTGFFTSNMETAQDAMTYGLSWVYYEVMRGPREKANAMPVRCIRDF
ncbi:MAG TPA: FISUMP domain-containing protein [Bacteroidales bacterium]|nr:FISUMP domain-containing protein [Bacteroidales bacterium]HSA42765.1 FISUMP domain-containing protein [Bacteroidales bacterium]